MPLATAARPFGAILALTAVLALSGGAPAGAMEFCSEPLPPVCADMGTAFEDETLARQCHQDVALFQERLDEYEACIVRQIAGHREEAATALERLECVMEQRGDC